MTITSAGLLALVFQAGVVSDVSLIHVVQGADTASFTVTDTIEVPVGDPFQLVAELYTPDGDELDVWWHNTSGGLLQFEQVRGWVSSGAVTATRAGTGGFMAHWGDTQATSLDLVFRAVEVHRLARSRPMRPRPSRGCGCRAWSAGRVTTEARCHPPPRSPTPRANAVC